MAVLRQDQFDTCRHLQLDLNKNQRSVHLHGIFLHMYELRINIYIFLIKKKNNNRKNIKLI